MQRRNFFKWLGSAAVVAIAPKINFPETPPVPGVELPPLANAGVHKVVVVPKTPNDALMKLFHNNELIGYCVGNVNCSVERPVIDVRSLNSCRELNLSHESYIPGRPEYTITAENAVFYEGVDLKGMMLEKLHMEVITKDNQMTMHSDCFISEFQTLISTETHVMQNITFKLSGLTTIEYADDEKKHKKHS